jgi:hypothetical protein
LLFPAETETEIPSATRASIAESKNELAPPPKLKFATADLVVWWAITESAAATMPEVDPDPEQLNTRTAYSVTPGATP